jgi:hypothetical protein
VGDGAAGGGEELDVALVEPDGVDDHHPLVEEPEIVDVPHQRFAELHLAKHPLHGLEDVDVERQVVPPRQTAGGSSPRHPLGAEHGRRRQAAVSCAVPARSGDRRIQLAGRLARRAIHGAALASEQLGEGRCFVLHDVRLIDCDRGADRHPRGTPDRVDVSRGNRHVVRRCTG